jgi:N6-adenosine-specific RNA methylase IME4
MAYRTIVADPPWPQHYNGGGRRKGGGSTWSHGRYYTAVRSPGLGYETMTVDAICALAVAELAEDDAHLYLWIPDRFLIEGDGARVCRAWGFRPGRTLVWHKPNWGLGTFPRPQHESVIVAKRGSLPYALRDVGSVQEWKQVYERAGRVMSKKGSAKPDGFVDLVERASPGPYLELFARRQRLGWDTWGDEALEHVELTS